MSTMATESKGKSATGSKSTALPSRTGSMKPSRSGSRHASRTAPSKTGPSRVFSFTGRSMTAGNTMSNSQPQIIGEFKRQMATPVDPLSQTESLPTRNSKTTGVTKMCLASTVQPSRSASTMRSMTASTTLPTRNSKTTGVTKMCLATTVAPTKSASSMTSKVDTPKHDRDEFVTFKPAASKSSTRAPSRSRSTRKPSKSGKSGMIRTCPGDTKTWGPVSGGRSTAGKSVTASRGDVESGMYASEYIVAEEGEEKESCSTCCCIFWILAIIALILLLCFGGWYLFIRKDEEKIQTKIDDKPSDIVIVPPTPIIEVVETKKYPGFQYNDGTQASPVWRDYDAATSYLLYHQSLSRSDLTVNLGNDRMFSIDFKEMRQYNLKWDTTNNCHIYDNTAHKYVRDAKFRTIKKVIFTEGQRPKLEAAYKHEAHRWECNDAGTWKAYPNVISTYIDIKQMLNPKAKFLVDLGNDILFRIDLVSKQQISFQYKRGAGHGTNQGQYIPNGKSRQIRRTN